MEGGRRSSRTSLVVVVAAAMTMMTSSSTRLRSPKGREVKGGGRRDKEGLTALERIMNGSGEEGRGSRKRRRKLSVTLFCTSSPQTPL